MTARAGMVELIQELRVATEAGTEDYSVNGTAYWTDDQIQDILDEHRQMIVREPMRVVSFNNGGTIEYKDYFWQHGPVERHDGSEIIFRIEDSNGSAIGSGDWSINYPSKQVTFSADQAAGTRYLTYRTFDLERAAAKIWNIKASHVAGRYDVETDNHKLKRNQLVKEYRNMADRFMRQAQPRVSRVIRGDARW